MEKILVTGATGKLGREVLDLLLNKIEAKNLSVLVRDTSKVEDLKLKGVNIFKGNYENYNSLVNAFKGIDKLYFISTNDFSNREIQQGNVVKAAEEAKVKHIVYTSFQRKNENGNSPIGYILDVHIFTEKLIKSSGLTYTILKHGLYSDFLPNLIGNNVIESGTIYLPAGNGKVAFTLRSDLAAGAIAILTSKGHENKTYEFSADKLYSFGDIAAMLSEIKGKSISYVSPSSAEFKDTLTKAGVPEMFVNMFAGCAEGIKQGEFEISDNTLSKLLGRNCVDMATYLRKIY